MRAGEPVGKIARRLGIGPTVKTLKVIQKRPTPPGMHGKRRGGTRSVYGVQLIEKQKLKFQFMISEKVLRRNYKNATKRKGSTGENLIRLLDERLDATIFRSGIVRSMLAARQLVTHRHVLVNGRLVNKPSFRLRPNDIVSFSEAARSFGFLSEGIETCITPSYLELDKEQKTIRRLVVPDRHQVPVDCNEQAIVEWYSR